MKQTHAGHIPISPEALQLLTDGREQFLAFLTKRVGSRDIAEDILQEAFVRGMERGGALRQDETAVAWFYRVLRNAVIDHFRKEAADIRAMENWRQAWEREPAADEETRHEVCGCLHDFLGTLKPEYRLALELVDMQGESLKTLAGAAEITAGNAAVRLHRAREALRKQISRACDVCAEHGCLDCHCKPCTDASARRGMPEKPAKEMQ